MYVKQLLRLSYKKLQFLILGKAITITITYFWYHRLTFFSSSDKANLSGSEKRCLSCVWLRCTLMTIPSISSFRQTPFPQNCRMLLLWISTYVNKNYIIKSNFTKFWRVPKFLNVHYVYIYQIYTYDSYHFLLLWLGPQNHQNRSFPLSFLAYRN